MYYTDNSDFLRDLEEAQAEIDSDLPPGFIEIPDDETADFPDFFDIADRFVDLYVSYRQRYVMMINGAIFVPKKKDSGFTPLSNSHICKHLHQRFSIGIFAGPYSSKFVCFDVDDGSRETVRKIILLAQRFGIPKEYIYVSSSGGKGYHVEIFFDHMVYTEKLLIFYDWMICAGKLDSSKVEFRPTHKQAIKLPLSKHAKTGNICWFLDRETFKPIEDMAYILKIEKFSADTFNELVDKCGLRRPISSAQDEDMIAEMDPTLPKPRVLTQQEQQLIDGFSVYPDITQPGQRHQLTRSIAIHNRKIGMTPEESIDALTKWWGLQDREITLTSDKEALADIHDLVAWTFSPAFVIPHRIKKLTITKDMLRVVLSMETKTERKLLFLIACFCSVYGRMNMGYERMAKYLGVKAYTLQRLIPTLTEEGWIKTVKSKSSFSDGSFSRKPNTYYLNTPTVYEGTRGLDVDFIFEEPLVHEAQERSQSDEDGRLKTFIPELEPDGFTNFYYLILSTTVSKKSLKGFLTKGEMDALQAVLVHFKT